MVSVMMGVYWIDKQGPYILLDNELEPYFLTDNTIINT